MGASSSVQEKAQTSSSPAPNNDTPAKKECKDDSCKLTGPIEQPKAQPNKAPLKPCCACPETKKARDTCIIEKGEENCKDLIEAHKECMRKMGFNI